MKALIVDDELPGRQRIRSLLEGVDDVEVVGECSSGAQAIALIKEVVPDLLFLDIQMAGIDGFGVIAALTSAQRPRAIIFVTAYDQYAVRAFEVSAVDYLLKPFSEGRFLAAIKRARTIVERHPESDPRIDALLRTLAERPRKSERLAIRSRDGVQFVAVDEIDWLEGDGNYTTLHMATGTLRIRQTITQLEERLAPAGFVRIHRSIIVRADCITRLEAWGNTEYVVYLRTGAKLQSSRTYHDAVRKLTSI